MRSERPSRHLSSVVFSACALLVALTLNVCAQEGESAEGAANVRVFAEKFDEYGRLRHCDLTARLDNFALSLQNEPDSEGFVVGYSSDKDKAARAPRQQLKIARYYLVEERGIDPARLVFVEAGQKDGADNALNELWLVPRGGTPPVPIPDAGPPKEFSGKLDSYSTDENVYREIAEVGYAYSDLAFDDFAATLKRQPESVGYLVIRASKNSLPGAWRRIARRDEQIIRKEHGIDAGRLRSIDAGYSDDEFAEVELWILPDGAPPPPGLTEKLTRLMKEAFRLNSLESDGEPDGEEAQWLLENVAESLRDDPKSRALLIVRRYEGGEESAGGEEASSVGESPVTGAGDESGAAEGASAADGDAGKREEEGEGAEDASADPQEMAERWKRALVEKHGVEEHRIDVVSGSPRRWEGAHIETWIVPSDAPPPDPLIITRELDEEESPEDAQEAEAPQPPEGL